MKRFARVKMKSPMAQSGRLAIGAIQLDSIAEHENIN